jgi:hypothetical protein
MLAVGISQCYVVAECFRVPDAGCIAGKGLVHCLVEVLEQENSPWADTAHGNQYTEQLSGFCQGEVISAGSRTPIIYQIGEELLPFISWNGNRHCPSISNVPELAAGMAHGVFEKLLRIRLARADVRFVVSKDSDETRDTASHSPSHLVGASGTIQIVINVHIVFDWG